jgi:hypothetical protein
VNFGYAKYVGGHATLGRNRQGNFWLTADELGIGTLRPKVAVIALADVASIEIVGGQVAKRSVGAVAVFGVLGGLAAKGAKNETAVVVRTKDGETAYYTIDKQSPVNVRAKITPLLKAAGVPFADELAAPAAAASSKSSAEPPSFDPIQRLRELAELRDKGVLTEEEFAAQKAKLLG